jgi:hypothetical protein
MKRRPPPTFPNKRRKRWSEIEEQALIEGVEKYYLSFPHSHILY